ncbi:MAG: SHOCT domain-containing protein [Lachnospiraceae bacterium]|nr:SHOCT domain-containing protein [Lachnospiraceae bacterium]
MSLFYKFAVISNKRVYFRGSCFSGQGKSLVKTDEEQTVDIKDVTGSGFIYRRYLGILLGLLTALAALLTSISFSAPQVISGWKDVKWYQTRADDAKATIAEESASKVVVTESLMQSPAQNNVPDELRKYSELLKEGLISQEEYNAVKKSLCSLSYLIFASPFSDWLSL